MKKRTAVQVAKAFRGLGLHTKEQLAVTGVRGSLSKKEGAELTILGEMDAIGCRNHQKADKEMERHTPVAIMPSLRRCWERQWLFLMKK